MAVWRPCAGTELAAGKEAGIAHSSLAELGSLADSEQMRSSLPSQEACLRGWHSMDSSQTPREVWWLYSSPLRFWADLCSPWNPPSSPPPGLWVQLHRLDSSWTPSTLICLQRTHRAQSIWSSTGRACKFAACDHLSGLGRVFLLSKSNPQLCRNALRCQWFNSQRSLASLTLDSRYSLLLPSDFWWNCLRIPVHAPLTRKDLLRSRSSFARISDFWYHSGPGKAFPEGSCTRPPVTLCYFCEACACSWPYLEPLVDSRTISAAASLEAQRTSFLSAEVALPCWWSLRWKRELHCSPDLPASKLHFDQLNRWSSKWCLTTRT